MQNNLKKEVLFLTEALLGGGLGHVVRTFSLFSYFKKRNSIPTLIINSKPLQMLPLSGDILYQNWNETISETSGNTVVIDSYQIAQKTIEDLKNRFSSIILFDDFFRIRTEGVGIINSGCFNCENQYPKSNRLMLGPNFFPLRESLYSPTVKNIQDTAQNVLVFFGGEDAANLSLKTATFLSSTGYDLEIFVIVGESYPHSLEKLESVKNCKVFRSPDIGSISKLFDMSDICISACGQSLFELAHYGVPTIGVKVADNQDENINLFSSNRFLENVLEPSYNFQEFFFSFSSMLDPIKRNEKARIGRLLVDGKGCNRIYQSIIGD